jgi:hypothetical protein
VDRKSNYSRKEQKGKKTEDGDWKEDFRDFARGKQQQNLMQPPLLL